MEKLNKKIAAVLVLVCLLTFPFDALAQQTRQGDGEGWCKFAKRTGALATGNAFAFGLIPGLQPVGIAFGAYAVIARGYSAFYCE